MAGGIFYVTFNSSINDHGDGLVVVKDGSANGGDAHYLYRGKVPEQSGKFESEFLISKWKDGNTSVVNMDDFALAAHGEVDYEKGIIQLSGSVVGQPGLTIEIKGSKIKEAL